MNKIIDNDIYNQVFDGWWQADSFLNVLETGIHPIRSTLNYACNDSRFQLTRVLHI